MTVPVNKDDIEIGRLPDHGVHGGEFIREVLAEHRDEKIKDIPEDYARKTSLALAAMILDQMQQVPDMLDFVAMATDRLFDFERYNKEKLTLSEVQQLFLLRKEALTDIKDLMAYTRNFVKGNASYLVSTTDKDTQRFKALVALMTPEQLKTAIAMIESILRS